MEEQKIEVRLGYTATSEKVMQERPDAVIVATGAVPFVPEMPGTESHSVCTAWEVLEGTKKIENKVVIVAGGGIVGCETALYLSSGNKKVFLVEMLEGLALDIEPINRMELLKKVQESGIEVLLGRELKRVEPGKAVLSKDGRQEDQVTADFIVFALGSISENALARELEDRVGEVYTVGDSCEPRKIIDAVYEGFRCAINI